MSLRPDQAGVETVRSYVAAQRGKPEAELISFNEGVMAASLALGAFIDAAKDTPPEAQRVLETAFESMTRVRIAPTNVQAWGRAG